MSGIPPILQKQYMLQTLPPDLAKLVADCFVPVSMGFGSVIIDEGDEADTFYVLVSGRARVLKRKGGGEEIPLEILRAGDSFGEMALLDDRTRTATVRATTDVELLKLDKAVFQALVRNHPDIREHLALRTRHRALHNFFRLNSAFAELPVAALRTMLDELETEEAEPHQRVISEGEPGEAMYIVEEGRLRTFHERGGEREYLSYLRSGDFFGEVALFRGGERVASVETVSSCKLLRLTRETFQKLVARYPEFRARIEARIAEYDSPGPPRIPLDFAPELLSVAAAPHDPLAMPLADSAPPEIDGDFDAEIGPPSKRIRRFPHVQQIDEMDCGAACLAMVCRHYGRDVALGRIRQLVDGGSEGTSLRALCRGALALGLAARSVKVPESQLTRIPLPAILHWGGNHWVVLYDVQGGDVRIADPATSLRTVSVADLRSEWSGYAALFDYTEELERIPEGSPGLRWILPFARPYRSLMLRASALAVVLSGLQLLFPVFAQVIVDRVLGDRDVELLRTLTLSMGGVLLLVLLLTYSQQALVSAAAVRIEAAALDFITRRMLGLPMSYFNARRTEDIRRRLDGAREIRELLVHAAAGAVTAMARFAAAVALMFVYSPLLAAIFLATIPLYAILVQQAASKLQPLGANLDEAFGRYESNQADAVRGIETVKSVGGEAGFRNRMMRHLHGISRRELDFDRNALRYQALVRGMALLSTILFLWAGAHQVLAAKLTLGGLVAFGALVVMANEPIVTLLRSWESYRHSSVLVQRLGDLFEADPEQGADHSQLRRVPSLEGAIELQGVGFRYGGPESPRVLRDVSLRVPAGSKVAIVGRSGAGKTTLAKCLAGLLVPGEGTILYDGFDARTLDYRDLRRQVGFVQQDDYLFDDSIARNIAFGEEEPDMDRVIGAARIAHAQEFIDRLPLGHNTPVGENGLRLSAGQKQRIAIARAVYDRPPIMILDEATSALDTESEHIVQANLNALLATCTTFEVAHRLGSARGADRILVLERGALVEQGTHEELMARQGLYYYLCGQSLDA